MKLVLSKLESIENKFKISQDDYSKIVSNSKQESKSLIETINSMTEVLNELISIQNFQKLKKINEKQEKKEKDGKYEKDEKDDKGKEEKIVNILKNEYFKLEKQVNKASNTDIFNIQNEIVDLNKEISDLEIEIRLLKQKDKQVDALINKKIKSVEDNSKLLMLKKSLTANEKYLNNQKEIVEKGRKENDDLIEKKKIKEKSIFDLEAKLKSKEKEGEKEKKEEELKEKENEAEAERKRSILLKRMCSEKRRLNLNIQSNSKEIEKLMTENVYLKRMLYGDECVEKSKVVNDENRNNVNIEKKRLDPIKISRNNINEDVAVKNDEKEKEIEKINIKQYTERSDIIDNVVLTTKKHEDNQEIQEEKEDFILKSRYNSNLLVKKERKRNLYEDLEEIEIN